MKPDSLMCRFAPELLPKVNELIADVQKAIGSFRL